MMNILFKHVRFAKYYPEKDKSIDVRPLTRAEAERMLELVMEHSEDEWCDIEVRFAEEHTDGMANNVDWELCFEES